MSAIKVDLEDVQVLAQLVRLGFGALMQWRTKNGVPLDDAVTAEKLAAVPTHDFTAAVEEGEAEG